MIRQDDRMLDVPRLLGSGFHFASGRTVTFPNGLIILARSGAIAGSVWQIRRCSIVLQNVGAIANWPTTYTVFWKSHLKFWDSEEGQM